MLEDSAKRIVLQHFFQLDLLDERCVIDISNNLSLAKYGELFKLLYVKFLKTIANNIDKVQFKQTKIYEYLFNFSIANNQKINPRLYKLMEKAIQANRNNQFQELQRLLYLLVLLHDVQMKGVKFHSSHNRLISTPTPQRPIMGFEKLMLSNQGGLSRKSTTGMTTIGVGGSVCGLGERTTNSSSKILKFPVSSPTPSPSWNFPPVARPEVQFFITKRDNWEPQNIGDYELPYLSEAPPIVFNNLVIRVKYKDQTFYQVSDVNFISYCYDIFTGVSSCIIPEFSVDSHKYATNYLVSGISLKTCQAFSLLFLKFGQKFLMIDKIIKSHSYFYNETNPTVSLLILAAYYDTISFHFKKIQEHVFQIRRKNVKSFCANYRELVYSFDEMSLLFDIAVYIEGELNEIATEIRGYVLIDLLFKTVTCFQFHIHAATIYDIFLKTIQPFVRILKLFVRRGQLPTNSESFPIEKNPSDTDAALHPFVCNLNLLPTILFYHIDDVLKCGNSLKLLINLASLDSSLSMDYIEFQMQKDLDESDARNSINTNKTGSSFLPLEKTGFISQFRSLSSSESTEEPSNDTLFDVYNKLNKDIIIPLQTLIVKSLKDQFDYFIARSNTEKLIGIVQRVILNMEFDFLNDAVKSIMDNKNPNIYIINHKLSKLLNCYFDFLPQENLGFTVSIANDSKYQLKNGNGQILNLKISPTFPPILNLIFTEKSIMSYNKVLDVLFSVLFIKTHLTQILFHSLKSRKSSRFTSSLFFLNNFWISLGERLYNQVVMRSRTFMKSFASFSTLNQVVTEHSLLLKDLKINILGGKSNSLLKKQLEYLIFQSNEFINLAKSSIKEEELVIHLSEIEPHVNEFKTSFFG